MPPNLIYVSWKLLSRRNKQQNKVSLHSIYILKIKPELLVKADWF